jgi:SAM-dependent methyltransferase
MGEITRLSEPPPSAFTEEWYDLATEDHFWMRWRLAAFRRELKDLGVPTDAAWRGLDIGCGAGVFGLQLERSTAWIVDGTDLNEKALSLHAPRRGRTMLYDVHDRRPELAASYDFLLLFDVLEHVADVKRHLESSLHHLKPGGWLFVNVPALEALTSAYDRVVGHLRRYDAPSLRRELEGLPLEIRDLRYWGLSLIPLALLRRLVTSDATPRDELVRRGFQPPSAGINAALTLAQKLETGILSRPWAGTSLLAASVKRG